MKKRAIMSIDKRDRWLLYRFLVEESKRRFNELRPVIGEKASAAKEQAAAWGSAKKEQAGAWANERREQAKVTAAQANAWGSAKKEQAAAWGSEKKEQAKASAVQARAWTGQASRDTASFIGNNAPEAGRATLSAASATVSAASNIASLGWKGLRGGGRMVVNGLDALRPKSSISMFFVFPVVFIQILEVFSNYEIFNHWPERFIIYFSMAFFGVLFAGIAIPRATILSLFGFFAPLLWSNIIPKEVTQSPYFALINIFILLAATSWTWALLFSVETRVPGFFRIVAAVILAYGIIMPQLLVVGDTMGLDTTQLKVDPRFTIKFVEEGLKTSVDSAKDIPSNVNLWFSNWVTGQTRDIYAGNVDQNSRKDIGVYFQRVQAADPEYLEGDKVAVFADLKVQTLNNPIVISPKCWADKDRRDELQGVAVPHKITVDSYDIPSFDCKFSSLDAGGRTITMSAMFDFETMAYLKSYFMDEDKLRSIIREGKDPLDFYKVIDKQPIATYTNGPVALGMEIRSSLPVGLKPGETEKLPFGISLTNRWDGKIQSVSNVRFEVPDGFEVENLAEDCSHSFVFKGLIEGYNVYELDIAKERLNNPKLLTNIKESQSFRCYLKARDNKIPEILGKVPLSTKFFRASVKYQYTLDKTLSLEIKEKDKPPASLGGNCGVRLIGLARNGLGRPFQDGASWPVDQLPGSDEPIGNDQFVSWVYNRYSAVYKDSSISIADGYSGQSNAGTLVDGDLQTVSVPRYDALVGGDLLFFCGSYDSASGRLTDCSNGVGHEGIYVGNKRFIHVSDSVKEDSLTSYEGNYIGARRLCAKEKVYARPLSSDAISVIKGYAKDNGIPEKVALSIAAQESGIQHYAATSYDPYGNCDGKVKCGDSGYSLGIMQINTKSNAHPQCYGEIIYQENSDDMCIGARDCSGTDVRDLNCNIEASMRLLKGCYNEGQSNPSERCVCGKYSGWEYAIKCYNGCDCSNDYVEKVESHDVSGYLV